MESHDTNLIERAIAIALEVHAGQKDRHGAPYILHPLRVGLRAHTDTEMVAGFLHDVIEDSDGAVTLDTLRDMGFPDEVVTIVDHVSKRTVDGEEEPWEDYIARVMQHEGAMRLKLLDLEQNMDTTRISRFSDRDSARFARYVEAWHAIRERLGLE